MKSWLLVAALFALGGCGSPSAADSLPAPVPPSPRLGRTADAVVSTKPRPRPRPGDLSKTPEWAQRRMFGHRSPAVLLVGVEGGVIDGRQLAGQRRLIVYWDWGDREEEAAAVDFMQVLQKAQADLASKEVEIMFVHARFPSGRKAPMNDTDLFAWRKKWDVSTASQRFSRLSFFRFPTAKETDPARVVGLEGPFSVAENLAESPEIVMLDEAGTVRWHSAGIEDPGAIGSVIPDPEQATIIEAIEFALHQL